LLGIILAAGRGKRLEPVLRDQPKCLLDFGGTSILMHQVKALATVGIKDFVVVVGYEKEQIISHVANAPYRFTFVENPIYDETNTLYSLWLARRHFTDDFFYCNADVVFDYRIPRHLLSPAADSCLACTSHRCAEEEVKVIVADNCIAHIGKKLDVAGCYGEFIGVARFARTTNTRFAHILDECVKKDRALWNTFFEHAVDILAAEVPLRCTDVSDLPVVEIDFPEDLERARTQVFPAMHTTV